MKKIILTGVILFLFSCGGTIPTFEIISVTDKFTDPNISEGYKGEGNKLSKKSTKGGTHIDYRGVYVNPYVFKSNNITTTGFYVSHYNFDLDDLFRPIERLIFLNENKDRIELNCKSQDINVSLGSWNTVTSNYIGSSSELSSCDISLEDFKKIVNSSYLELKIIGNERSQTYEKDEVLPTFLENIKLFYFQKVDSTPNQNPL